MLNQFCIAGARHEDAKSRRERLWNERQLQFTARTQPGNRIVVRPSTGLTTSKCGNQASENTSPPALGPHYRTEMQLQLAVRVDNAGAAQITQS